MKTMTAFLVVVLGFSSNPVFSHPHFFKEVRFSFDQERSPSQSIVVSHITVPFNEIAAASLPEGGDWHLGFAKLEVGMPLEIGGKEIEPGRYSLNVRRGPGDEWSLFLVPDAKDAKERELVLSSHLRSDLPSEDHLKIEIHPTGPKDKTEIVLRVRFGPNGLSVPLKKRE